MDLLSWAIIALIISLVAGGLGFSGVAAGAAVAARWLFGIFLVICLLLFLLVLLGFSLVT
jgi:uncharacterized membrane protein YtjA (UPF0391 family)